MHHHKFHWCTVYTGTLRKEMFLVIVQKQQQYVTGHILESYWRGMKICHSAMYTKDLWPAALYNLSLGSDSLLAWSNGTQQQYASADTNRQLDPQCSEQTYSVRFVSRESFQPKRAETRGLQGWEQRVGEGERAPPHQLREHYKFPPLGSRAKSQLAQSI